MCVISPLLASTTFAADAPDVQESHPGLGNESRYAEAVIAFNRKQTDEAVKILDELLASSPKNIEYLELKALALKGKGDDRASLELYKQLYSAKPEKERGPYAFEIASILEKNKKSDLAKGYFLKSAELGFNVAASYLYVGLAEFNAGHYAEAETYFSKAGNSGIPEIDLVSQYYISLCYFKLNFSTRGIQELIDAKDIARKTLRKDPTNVNAKSINDAADKMLAPFSKGQWFGSASLMTQYDSNIQTLPTGSSNTAAASNASTIKENLLGNIGYMSAPNDLFQVVTGYRATYNKNFNSLTKAFEYFTNNASVYLNYRALAKTTYTAKVESNFAFQNALVNPLDTSSTEYQYQKYNFTMGGGLAIRHQVGRYWRLEGEANYHTQKFYADDTESGNDLSFSIATRRIGGDNYFNPGFTILYEGNNANGVLNYYKAYGLGLSNSSSLPWAITMNQGIDFLFTDYTKTAPLRTDSNFTFHVDASKQITAKISLLVDASYIKNLSSVDASYTYNRWLTSLGLSFSL